MIQNDLSNNPRVIIIQKLYSNKLNKDSEIIFPKHRYKKYIKDVVNGAIERDDLIQKFINKELEGIINTNKTELIVKLIIVAAIYEFMYMHKIPIKVVINEYLKASNSFIGVKQKNFLNAVLDKASKVCRVTNI
jgi:transcription antitermination protein NusB